VPTSCSAFPRQRPARAISTPIWTPNSVLDPTGRSNHGGDSGQPCFPLAGNALTRQRTRPLPHWLSQFAGCLPCRVWRYIPRRVCDLSHMFNDVQRAGGFAADARIRSEAEGLRPQSQPSFLTRIRSIRSGVLMPAASMWGCSP
jgi:hypothetical protein